MTSNVEHCIEFVGLANELAELLRVLPQSLLFLQKFSRLGILLKHLYAAGV